MNGSSTKPGIHRESLTVIGVAVLLTVVLLLLAFRSSSQPVKRKQDEFTGTETSKLLRLKKTDAVCQELLKRNGVSLPVLRDCLLHLAKSRRTTNLNILLAWIKALPADAPYSEQQNASRVLSDMSATQRQHGQEQMSQWAKDDLSIAAKRMVSATELATGPDRFDLLSAATDTDRLKECLIVLPLIPSVAVQESYYDDIQLLLARSTNEQSTADDPLQRLLITTIARMRGRDTDRARDLVELIVAKQHSALAIACLDQLPAESWPDQQLGFLAAAVIAFVADSNSEADRQAGFALGEKIANRLPEEKRSRFTKRLAELRAIYNESR